MEASKNIISIFFPQWLIDLHRYQCASRQCSPRNDRETRRPLLFVAALDKHYVVVQCCARGAARGVHPGMNLTHARALAPNAQIEQCDPAKRAEALTSLARWAKRFSPIVATDSASDAPTTQRIYDNRYDGITIDLTGSERLFGGKERVLTKLHHQLSIFGLTARIVCAPSLGAAWALSRYGATAPACLERSSLHQALAPLPLAALRIEESTEMALHEVHIKRIEQLLQLSPSALLSRFGPHLLKRLRQALDLEDEVIEPLRSKTELVEELIFNGSITTVESLNSAAHELLKKLVTRLLSSNEKACHVSITAEREGTAKFKKTVSLSAPSAKLDHLWLLIRTQLEQMHLGHGICALRLSVASTERVRAHPLRLSKHESARNKVTDEIAPTALPELLDKLQTQLTTAQVLDVEFTDSHLPERTFRYIPFVSALSGTTSTATPTRIIVKDRPSILFARPEEVRVQTFRNERLPHLVCWHGVDYAVDIGYGPERICSEWWNGRVAGSTRDYFKIQLRSGVWVWIFHSVETKQWFVHGVWA